MGGFLHTSQLQARLGTTDAGRPPVSAEPNPARETPLASWVPVGEALTGESSSTLLERCREVGRDLAEAGASVGEALAGLRSTTRRAEGREPTYREAWAVAEGWAESTLSYLHRLSCVDPLTGLASEAHVRESLLERYRRGACDMRAVQALVIAETPAPDGLVEHARLMTLLGEAGRSAFPDAVSVGRLGVRRVVLVVARDVELQLRVRLLRRMAPDARVSVEALPGTEDAAVALLDELATC